MADHEDYLPGEAPTPHHGTHEDGGTDQVSIAGLAGESLELAAHKILPSIHHLKYTDAEAQAVADARIAIHTAIATAHQDAPALIAAHAAIATAHQDAPALILAHKGDASAHHAKYTDGEAQAVADARIAIHAALPTVHQDAPALILAHKGDASAHHARYTDAESRAAFSPIHVPPTAFHRRLDTYDIFVDQILLKARASLAAQYYYAPVFFPDCVTVSKVTLYAYRDDAAATIMIRLYKSFLNGASTIMAQITAGWTTGWSSDYDDSISQAEIDNSSANYSVLLSLDPNDNIEDVKLSGVMIDFT